MRKCYFKIGDCLYISSCEIYVDEVMFKTTSCYAYKEMFSIEAANLLFEMLKKCFNYNVELIEVKEDE